MLFSADGEYLRKIDVLEDQITEKINALSELELTYIGEDPSYGERILVKEPDTNKWHEFVVRELNAKRSKSLIRKLYAVSSFCETEGDYLDEKRVRDGSAFNALSSMLSSTRWKPGTVSVKSGNKNISFYHTNPLKGLKELCETYQCEFQERVVVSDVGVVDRFLDLKTTIGEENAKRFEYAKDLQEVERNYEPQIVYTAMYGYGKGIQKTDASGEATGGFERKINFAEVNSGLKYVADEEARKVFGRPNGDGTKSHTFGVYENSQCEDKQQLLQETKDALKAQIQPKVSYNAKVIDLENYGFQFEGVGLGDAVTVIDKTFEPELRIRARVHSRKFSLYNNELTELELGSYTNVLKNALAASEHLAATIRAKENIWNRAGYFNENGTLSATYVEGLLEQITEEFKLGNNSIQTSVERGITIFNNKDESKATWGIQLSSRGLLIASSKRSNGEWNWTTAATGDGITANVINAGKLRGGAVNFDLDAGALTINGEIAGQPVTVTLDGSNVLSIDSGDKFIGGLVSRDDGTLALQASTVGYSKQSYAEVGKTLYQAGSTASIDGLGLYWSPSWTGRKPKSYFWVAPDHKSQLSNINNSSSNSYDGFSFGTGNYYNGDVILSVNDGYFGKETTILSPTGKARLNLNDGEYSSFSGGGDAMIRITHNEIEFRRGDGKVYTIPWILSQIKTAGDNADYALDKAKEAMEQANAAMDQANYAVDLYNNL